MAPPIPFHAQLKNVNESHNNLNNKYHQNQNQNQNQHHQSQIVSNISDENELISSISTDEIIRPRVDPKLLSLMNLNNKNNGIDDNTFFDLDLDCLTNKPWNDKSVDITDWFNYGFNEETWRKYCNTQLKLRLILKKQQQQHLLLHHQQQLQVLFNQSANGNISNLLIHQNDNNQRKRSRSRSRSRSRGRNAE